MSSSSISTRAIQTCSQSCRVNPKEAVKTNKQKQELGTNTDTK